ncbi:MAG: magnesium-translocating P-type ATPase [Nanoarchaeota archaeon]|nr:magnesium-translocating P-type ATPase [Nanoarchaeota archaeon]MBU0977405.1 magnesium-translocating P-type ATPase [Nanoarchaeota archaeon]
MDEVFYSSKESEVLHKLGSSEKGLSSVEAERRLDEYGPNEIPEKGKRSVLAIFFSQFSSPLILILIFASIVAGFLREITNAAIILGIILVNASLGFYQEYKSEKALKKLKKYITFKAQVLRDGKKIEVYAKDLVPGDIVTLNIGDIVPADMRLLYSQELLVNESAITGESLPIEKRCGLIDVKKAAVSQMSNSLFMGSTIAGGAGRGVVVSTGRNTEFGKTASVLSVKEPPSDFQKGIGRFGGFLLKLIFFLSLFVFAVNAFFGKGWLDSFLFALALAVGITPELLPIIVTISLSSGAIHMAKKKVIVKKLASIEDLGNVDVLCVDKTGTLTENKVSVESYLDIEGKPKKEIMEFALNCNNAVVEEASINGNAIDVAICEYALKNKIGVEKFKRLDEIEFDFNRRRMSVVVQKNREKILISKGEPLAILKVCDRASYNGRVVPIKDHAGKIQSDFQNMGRQGLRVIAVAYKKAGSKKNYSEKDEESMIFAGFVVFSDPLKESVKDSLRRIKNLGVEIKVLTGDNELVTEKICKEAELNIKGKIVLGSEVEDLDDRELERIVEANNVFARVTPEQKFRIVSALNRTGHIVGFLGDGINDCPGLKVADVGISVDSATDVAKESADVILLDKSLAVVADGITEGRKTFGNITKYILNTISANFGNMFTLAAASLYFQFIPLLPAQILLLNFISDVPLTAISTDKVDESYLHRPKRWNINMISRFMVFFGVVSMIFDFITIALIWFVISPNNPDVFRTVWFTESVLSEMIIIFSLRTEKPFWKSRPSKMLVWTTILGILMTLVVLYIAPVAGLFELGSVSLPVFGILILLLVFYLFMCEIGKRIFYAREKRIVANK